MGGEEGGVSISHQHGLDEMSVVQFEERLAGLLIGRIKKADRFDHREFQFVRQLLTQKLGDIGKLGGGAVEMLIQPLPDLLGAVGRFAP